MMLERNNACVWILELPFVENTCSGNFKVNNHDFFNFENINGVRNSSLTQL